MQSGYQGFLYENGIYTTFADPLAAFGTYAQGINDAGQIVGFYADSGHIDHGFLYFDGVFTTIDDPLGVNGTVVTGINNLGQVVGYYKDAGGAFHGFEAAIPNTTAEDTPLTINGVSVSDADAGSAQIKVTLAVANGTLTLGDETGLDSVSNDHSGSVDLYGSQAAIDAALASGVIYTPNANYNGSDTLSVTADDQGNTGTGGDQFDSKVYDITVAPRPSIYWAATAGIGTRAGTGIRSRFLRPPTTSSSVLIRMAIRWWCSWSTPPQLRLHVHSLYLSNIAELDATDVTIGGNLAVDSATLTSYGADLTVHSVGGSATVSADYGDSSQITAASGSLVFGDIDGDFTVSALTSDPGFASQANVQSDGGDLTIGNIGGDLTVAATGDIGSQSSAYLEASYRLSLHRRCRRQRLGDGGQ